jgi:hypothetical protein
VAENLTPEELLARQKREEIDFAYLETQQLRNNPDRVAVHNTQAEFDLELLKLFMADPDVHTFDASVEFFEAVEARGGSNANQRALYLGIPRTDPGDGTPWYDAITARYGEAQGARIYVQNSDGLVKDWT